MARLVGDVALPGKICLVLRPVVGALLVVVGLVLGYLIGRGS